MSNTIIDGTISIITLEDIVQGTDVTQETHSMFAGPASFVRKTVQIAANDLAENLTQFITLVTPVLEALPPNCGAYQIDELSFHVSVDGTGKVSLVGELSMGLASSISLVLRRKKE